ncbi:hypothetical protein FKM82_007770 [Ascaphus truei]
MMQELHWRVRLILKRSTWKIHRRYCLQKIFLYVSSSSKKKVAFVGKFYWVVKRGILKRGTFWEWSKWDAAILIMNA